MRGNLDHQDASDSQTLLHGTKQLLQIYILWKI